MSYWMEDDVSTIMEGVPKTRRLPRYGYFAVAPLEYREVRDDGTLGDEVQEMGFVIVHVPSGGFLQTPYYLPTLEAAKTATEKISALRNDWMIEQADPELAQAVTAIIAEHGEPIGKAQVAQKLTDSVNANPTITRRLSS